MRYRTIPSFNEEKIPSWVETQITPELLEEWWSLVSSRRLQLASLATLKFMWVGATKQLQSTEKNWQGVPWEAVADFLEGFGLVLSQDEADILQ